jgi:hypothetical protein
LLEKIKKEKNTMSNLRITISIGIFCLVGLFLTVTDSFGKVSAKKGFSVTEVLLKADDPFPKNECPHEVKFHGSIKTDGEGAVKYVFVRSDGATSAAREIYFEKAGTKEVETSWTLGANYEGYQAIKILSPNEIESKPKSGWFNLTCSNKSEQKTENVSQKVEVSCPTKEIRAEIITPLPSPWWQTPQVNSLFGVRIETIAGIQSLVCEYRVYGTTVGIMRHFPEGKTNCEANRDRFVCW